MTPDELLAAARAGPEPLTALLDTRAGEVTPELAVAARAALIAELRAHQTTQDAMYLAVAAREVCRRLGDKEAELENHLDVLNILYARTEDEQEYAACRQAAHEAVVDAQAHGLDALAFRAGVLATECAMHAFMVVRTEAWRAATLADGVAATALCGAIAAGPDFERLVYALAFYPALAGGSDLPAAERTDVARAAAWVREHVPDDWSFSADPVEDAQAARRLTELTTSY